MKTEQVAMQGLKIANPPPTLRELALERMRTAIHEFHFKPGQRLVERDVCEQLGVSRSVVREVIRHLEAEGLLETVPHQGPRVATMDAGTAAQIYELRALLESAAAEAAAANAQPADIANMELALRNISAAYQREDFRAVLKGANDFYEAMFHCGGKQVAWEMVQRLNGRISWLRSLTVSSQGRSQTGPRQMKLLFEAIRRGDGSAAAKACRDHVGTAAEIARRMLKE